MQVRFLPSRFPYKIDFILVVSRPSGLWRQRFKIENIFLNTNDPHVRCCVDMFEYESIRISISVSGPESAQKLIYLLLADMHSTSESILTKSKEMYTIF